MSRLAQLTKSLVFALAASCGTLVAQDANPAAKAKLDEAIAAMKSNNVDGALAAYQEAINTDPGVQALNDEGAGDWILGQLEGQAGSRSGEGAFLRGYGFMLQNKAGDYAKALEMYRKAKQVDPGGDAAGVDQQIATLEAWVKAQPAEDTSSGGGGGDGGGDAGTGDSGSGDSASGDSGGGSDPGQPDAAQEAQKATEEAQAQLQERDNQIKKLQEELNAEREKATKGDEALKAKDKELQYWRAKALGGG
jgi:tetratricopeptide (TPR) repeat protein